MTILGYPGSQIKTGFPIMAVREDSDRSNSQSIPGPFLPIVLSGTVWPCSPQETPNAFEVEVMAFNAPRKDTFENVAQRLYAFLALALLLFVGVANILAYAFCPRYRSTFPPGKFVLCTLAWTGLTLAFWWMNRQIERDNGPFRPPRKPPLR